MAYVTTPQQLQDEVLRRLGAPVVQVEVTEDQVKDCIDQALELFIEYHHEGTRKVFLAIQVSQDDIDNGGIFYVDRPIQAISDVIHNSDVSAAGLGFARDFVMAFPSWIGYAHGGNHATAQGMFSQNNTFSVLTNDMWEQYAKEWERRFTDEIIWQWNARTQELMIFNNLVEGQLIVVEAWVPTAVPLDRLIDPSTTGGDTFNPAHAEDARQPQFNTEGFQNALNDRWVKDYTTALVKRLNGTILKKFQGQKLPGGLEVDGQSMFDEAGQEIERLREELYSLELPMPVIFY